MWTKRLLFIVIFIAYLQSFIFPIDGVTGTIKFYNANKSFGFIAGDDGKDYFFQAAGLMANNTINEGDRVKFKIVQGDKGPKADSLEKISSDLEQISNASNITISNGTIQNATANGLNQNLTKQRQTGQTRLHLLGPQTLNMIGPEPRTNDSDDSDEDKLR